MNLLFVLGVRFLAPLELTDTTVQIILLWLYIPLRIRIHPFRISKGYPSAYQKGTLLEDKRDPF